MKRRISEEAGFRSDWLPVLYLEVVFMVFWPCLSVSMDWDTKLGIIHYAEPPLDSRVVICSQCLGGGGDYPIFK